MSFARLLIRGSIHDPASERLNCDVGSHPTGTGAAFRESGAR